MFSKLKLQKYITILVLIWAFILSGLIVQTQNVVTSFDLSGSGAFVLRGSSTAKKKSFVATRKSSTVRRTTKQRKITRQNVVRQSQTVAKKSRTRRKIEIVTPKELEQSRAKSKPPKEASKIFTGAGEYFLENGDVLKAAEYFDEAIALDSTNKDAKLGLSEAYTSLGDKALEVEDFKKAKSYYEAAIKNDDKNASAYAGLGQIYDESDDDEKAKANYEQALQIDPEFKQVYAPLGIIYYQEKKYDKSEEFINKALADDADNPETLYFLGLLKYLANDNQAALKALQKSISLDQENAEAYYYLGATYDRLDQDEKAIAAYQKSVQLDPNYVNAWFDLGVAYYNQGRYDEAIKAYDKAISLNTNQTQELQTLYTESYENRGDAYFKQVDTAKTLSDKKDKVDKATGDYNIVSYRKKNDAEFLGKYALALSKQAIIYNRSGLITSSWDNAIKNMEKAASLNSDAINLTNLGFINYQIGHNLAEAGNAAQRNKAKPYLDKAKELLQKAISMNPEFSEAPLLNLGATYIDTGDYDLAIETLKKSAQKRDWNIINFLIGIAYARENKLDDASRYLNTAVDRDEDNLQYLNELANVEVKRKDKKEIRKLIDRLKKLGTEVALKKAASLEKVLK